MPQNLKYPEDKNATPRNIATHSQRRVWYHGKVRWFGGRKKI